jgi:hypothetical protein
MVDEWEEAIPSKRSSIVVPDRYPVEVGVRQDGDPARKFNIEAVNVSTRFPRNET